LLRQRAWALVVCNIRPPFSLEDYTQARKENHVSSETAPFVRGSLPAITEVCWRANPALAPAASKHIPGVGVAFAFRICIPQGRLPHVKPRRNTRDSSDASHHRHSQRRSDFEIASRHSLETALPLHRRVHGCSCHRIPTRMTLRHTTYRSVGCRIPGVAGREKAGGRRRGEMGQEIEGSPLLGQLIPAPLEKDESIPKALQWIEDHGRARHNQVEHPIRRVFVLFRNLTDDRRSKGQTKGATVHETSNAHLARVPQGLRIGSHAILL
jgi:hypothetical protein